LQKVWKKNPPKNIFANLFLANAFRPTGEYFTHHGWQAKIGLEEGLKLAYQDFVEYYI
jgi:hypothetical protein